MTTVGRTGCSGDLPGKATGSFFSLLAPSHTVNVKGGVLAVTKCGSVTPYHTVK